MYVCTVCMFVFMYVHGCIYSFKCFHQSHVQEGLYYITYSIEPMVELLWREKGGSEETRYKALLPISTPLLPRPPHITDCESLAIISVNLKQTRWADCRRWKRWLNQLNTDTVRWLVEGLLPTILKSGPLKRKSVQSSHCKKCYT